MAKNVAKKKLLTREDIRLGDLVQDKITGAKGIVIARTQWLNQCDRYFVQPQELKDGEPVKPRDFDEGDLVLLEEDPLGYEREEDGASTPANGGPRPAPTRASVHD